MTGRLRQPVLTGGCQCGAVRYALYASLEVSICHCRMCQKAVGGPFVALAAVAAADFAWTRGRPGRFDSSSLAARGFCPACGTPLTYQAADGLTVDVTVGSLDTPEAAAPTQQHGIESRLSWSAALAGLPGARTDASYAGAVCHQHPDHD